MQGVVIAGIFLAAIAFAVLVDSYLRRSMRSLAHAESILNDIEALVAGLSKNELPIHLSVMLEELLLLAGRGKFVRSMILAHYLPSFLVHVPDDDSDIGLALEEIDKISPRLRAEISKFIGLVIAYDSFRNPLQGWLFRRAIKSFRRVRPVMDQKIRYEALVSSAAAVDKSHAVGRFRAIA